MILFFKKCQKVCTQSTNSYDKCFWQLIKQHKREIQNAGERGGGGGGRWSK